MMPSRRQMLVWRKPGRSDVRKSSVGFSYSTKDILVWTVLVGALATAIFASSTIYRLNYNLPYLDHIAIFGNSTTVHSRSTLGDEPVIGYAITVSGCGTPKIGADHAVEIVDVAAVLQHSIHAVSSRVGASRYNYQMYAFVHPEADHCASEQLRSIGYEVQLRATPLNVTAEIQNELLRKAMNKQGCCGDKELLKLYSLHLTQHPIVVHMDLDSILLQPLDHLFDIMLSPSLERRIVLEQARQFHDGENETHIIQRLYEADPPKEITSMFSRDYAMAVNGAKFERVGMQGGFWMVKPNLTVFDEFMATIRAQNYVDGCGWGGCSYGKAWFYGAANFQGLVSYYYSQLQQTLHPNQAYVELDRCKYNSMADGKRDGCDNGADTVACDDCFDTPLEQIHGAHFTLCQKPYWCPGYPQKSRRLCHQFHRIWHMLRQDWEYLQGQEDKLHNFSLTSLWPPPQTGEVASYEKLLRSEFPGHCPKGGDENYVPMNFHNITSATS